MPIAVYSKHFPIRRGIAYKCMEIWDSSVDEQIYTVFLDFILLIFPLVLMLFAYGMIASTLWRGIRMEVQSAQGEFQFSNILSSLLLNFKENN